MPHKIQAAIREDREARSAAHIAMVTHLTLDATLYQLRKLEGEGQIRHRVDGQGVMRWVMVDAEEVTNPAPCLGPQPFTGKAFMLTPAQILALGL